MSFLMHYAEAREHLCHKSITLWNKLAWRKFSIKYLKSEICSHIP